jgi:hypothetical protein
MVGMVRVGVLALVVAGVLLVTACGTTPSPTPSPASPSPLGQLGELAHRYRSDSGPTKAWSVKLPVSEASRVVGEDLAGTASDPQSASVYLVILNGAYTLGDGRPVEWMVLYPRTHKGVTDTGVPEGEAAVLLKKRPLTPGRAWTPLELASQ